ncbi:uncharacterized protein BDW47DRAFT_51873 [Aspergillus candidus]|uniref:Alpha/Beta hydrolase protein n=1 Tax=Aspergillus candidus TaxID=41067 RepID=A0A2I2F6Z2_ASPCN|nr:hypothetical protein BDW47DRAFT_51873 [Aspergillus candidus]PLB36399.1 hypothetical protein BDW47DRAFT_51873 [Aspergillus candidus]
MAALTFRALFLAALLALLVPYCSAFRYSKSEYGTVEGSEEQDIYSAEAGLMVEDDNSEAGEDHGDINVPDGARFTSFKINDHGHEEMPGFINEDIENKDIEHLFIVLHGRLRNGNTYWKTMHDSVTKARKDDFPGSERKVAVLTPQFFSKKYNSGQYTDVQLAWDDLNAWQPGGKANHPANTTLTSFDVLDGLVKLHSDKEKYPNLTNVTVIGHGGGGQLAQRYSAVGNDPPENVHVRYIHGDPSSCMYFTPDRPILSDNSTSKESCTSYNTWRYGFDDFPARGGKDMTPKDYFKQYLSRDIVSIVGMQDTGSAGDTSCMGKLQGGKNRRTRNLIWFRYINTLARTNEDLEGFPGEYGDLPDWSGVVGGKSQLRLVAVPGVAHNAKKLFHGDLGRGALFSDGDVDPGWRPKNNGSSSDSGGSSGSSSGSSSKRSPSPDENSSAAAHALGRPELGALFTGLLGLALALY